MRKQDHFLVHTEYKKSLFNITMLSSFQRLFFAISNHLLAPHVYHVLALSPLDHLDACRHHSKSYLHSHCYSCVSISHKQDIDEKMEHDFIQVGRWISDQVEEELRTHIYSMRYKRNNNQLAKEEKQNIVLTFTNKKYTLLENRKTKHHGQLNLDQR